MTTPLNGMRLMMRGRSERRWRTGAQPYHHAVNAHWRSCCTADGNKSSDRQPYEWACTTIFADIETDTTVQDSFRTLLSGEKRGYGDMHHLRNLRLHKDDEIVVEDHTARAAS
jgi:hypothetical protein